VRFPHHTPRSPPVGSGCGVLQVRCTRCHLGHLPSGSPDQARSLSRACAPPGPSRPAPRPTGGLLRLPHANHAPRALACHLSMCWVPYMEPPRFARGDHSH